MITEDARCIGCEDKMRVLIGMDGPGVFDVVAMDDLMSRGQLKGAFRCGSCKIYYCWDCSSGTKPCKKCRAQAWQERQYFPMSPQPPILIDDTGAAMLFGQGTSYVTRKQAGVPNDIDTHEFNLYQKERARASTGSVFWRLAVPAGVVGLLLWFVIVKLFGFGWLVVVAVGGAIVTAYALMMAYGVRDARNGILFSCPRCHNHIRATSQSPASAWMCLRCDFNHFKYWRARRLGPSKGVTDVGDVSHRREEASELFVRAKTLVEKGHIEEAMKLLDDAIRLYPNDANLHDQLGFCYFHASDYDRAIQESYRAVELDPNVPRFHTNLGYRLLKSGKPPDDGRRCARKALDIDPNFESARKLLQMADKLERSRK